MNTLNDFIGKYKKQFIGLFLFLIIAYAYKSFMFEEHELVNHQMIGKQIVFNKPLIYKRERWQYRSIVDKIGVYLSPIYHFDDKEALVYIPSGMKFTVRSIYFTDVKFSGQEIFYILVDIEGVQSIISENDVNFILSDMYEYHADEVNDITNRRDETVK